MCACSSRLQQQPCQLLYPPLSTSCVAPVAGAPLPAAAGEYSPKPFSAARCCLSSSVSTSAAVLACGVIAGTLSPLSAASAALCYLSISFPFPLRKFSSPAARLTRETPPTASTPTRRLRRASGGSSIFTVLVRRLTIFTVEVAAPALRSSKTVTTCNHLQAGHGRLGARPSIFNISIPPSRPVLSAGSRTCGIHTR